MEPVDWFVSFVDAIADGIRSVIPSVYTALCASGNKPGTCNNERFYQFLAVSPLLLRFEGATICLDKDCRDQLSGHTKNLDIRLDQTREPRRIIAELKRWHTPQGNTDINPIVNDIKFLRGFDAVARIMVVTTMHSQSQREENLRVLFERIDLREPTLCVATLPRHVATVALDDTLVIDVIGLAV